MKKIFILFNILPCLLFAQVKKGTYYLNLSMSVQNGATITNNNTGTHTASDYSLPLSKIGFGKFINNNNGISLFVLGSVNYVENSFGSKNHSFGIGMGHWFVYPVNEHWGFLLNNEIYGRYGRSKFFNDTEDKVYFNEWSLSASPGVYGVFFKKIFLQANINFLSANITTVTNNPEVPKKFQQDETHTITVAGVLPGAIRLSDIQFMLSYIIN